MMLHLGQHRGYVQTRRPTWVILGHHLLTVTWRNRHVTAQHEATDTRDV